jgi:chromosome segregation and condensation protein ScpB
LSLLYLSSADADFKYVAVLLFHQEHPLKARGIRTFSELEHRYRDYAYHYVDKAHIIIEQEYQREALELDRRKKAWKREALKKKKGWISRTWFWLMN